MSQNAVLCGNGSDFFFQIVLFSVISVVLRESTLTISLFQIPLRPDHQSNRKFTSKAVPI